ncbi:YqhA family protein [Methanolobus sp. ZRKC2]|uniref:YqhA family protein n=1 Tax=Methanolobus sp. ZRKC2 TaxID=3125783 RepID=UPI0032493604
MSALRYIITFTRYLIIIPVIGLIIASALLFVFGGYELLDTLYRAVTDVSYRQEGFSIIDIVEFVHVFLIGTVLWITAAGFFQLFVRKVDLPKWMQITDIEELETDLIGMVVVVLAVSFLGIVYSNTADILEYGAAIALPIAALALYINVRGKRSVIHEKILANESGQSTENKNESKDD